MAAQRFIVSSHDFKNRNRTNANTCRDLDHSPIRGQVTTTNTSESEVLTTTYYITSGNLGPVRTTVTEQEDKPSSLVEVVAELALYS